MDLLETTLYYLKKCNKEDGRPHVLTILATSSGTTFSVSEKDEVLVEKLDLESIVLWLKHYVSWEE